MDHEISRSGIFFLIWLGIFSHASLMVTMMRDQRRYDGVFISFSATCVACWFRKAFLSGTEELWSRLHRLEEDKIAQLGLGSEAKQKVPIAVWRYMTLQACHSRPRRFVLKMFAKKTNESTHKKT